ncbi:MAG: hypothetical protein ACTS4X_01990 [Candidatus Hodgkinia cicadicola]
MACYGCETWTRAEEEKKLNSFEIWCFRRILKIKWIHMVTNEEVLERVGEKRSFWESIVRRRVQLTGHIMRHEDLLKIIIEGYVDEKRPRGRPRLRYKDQIVKDVGCKIYGEVKRTRRESKSGDLLQTNPRLDHYRRNKD